MIAEKITLTREELFIHLYETAFPKVVAFIHKMGGSLEETKDIFQDAMLIYYEKKIDGELSLETTDTQYLAGIARHLWYKKFKENKITKPLNADLYSKVIEEEPKISENLIRLVATTGKKCMDLLTSFYYDKLNMVELAQKFGFAGERSATAQKYKCLEKVRDAIKNKCLTKEDFYE